MIAGQTVIAIEEHYATAAYLGVAHQLEPVSDDRAEVALMRGVETQPALRSRLVDLTARVEEMDLCGIDQAVLSINPPAVQPFSGSEAAALAQQCNDELAGIVKSSGGRFGGFGTVAPQEPEAAAREIERIVGPLGLHGVMINSHTHGRYLDDRRFEALLASAESSGAAIYLHPRVPSPQLVGPFRDYGLLAALWGYQAEASFHAMRMIFSGVFDRHPKLNIILGHLGEGLPFWLRRLDNRYAWTLANAGDELGMVRLELTPSEYIHRNFAVTTSGMEDPRVLEFCLDSLGEDSIMFAVDFPYEDTKSATDFLTQAPLSSRQRAKVSHENAQRLLRLTSTP